MEDKNHGPEKVYYLHIVFARYRSEWARGGVKTQEDKEISTTPKNLFEIDE